MLLHPSRRRDRCRNIVPIAGTLRRSMRPDPPRRFSPLSADEVFFLLGIVSDPFRVYLGACAARFYGLSSTCFFFSGRARRATWNTRERRINISSNGLRAPGPTPRERRRNPLVAFIPAPLRGMHPLMVDAYNAPYARYHCAEGGRFDRVAKRQIPFFLSLFFPPRSHLRQSNWKAIYPSARWKWVLYWVAPTRVP